MGVIPGDSASCSQAESLSVMEETWTQQADVPVHPPRGPLTRGRKGVWACWLLQPPCTNN